MKKAIIIIFAAVLGITAAASILNIDLGWKNLKKNVEQIITNYNTTIVIVQEEQEYSVNEIIEEVPDAEAFIPEQYRKIVTELCKSNDVPLYVFAKLIQSESRWNPKARRTNYVYKEDGTPVLNKDGTRKIHSYDKGIAQLNSLNYDEFSWRFNNNQIVDPWNITMSLTISCRYISWLYDRTHSWYDAIAAYKCGLSKVRLDIVPIHIEEISKAIIDPKISGLDAKYFP